MNKTTQKAIVASIKGIQIGSSDKWYAMDKSRLRIFTPFSFFQFENMEDVEAVENLLKESPLDELKKDCTITLMEFAFNFNLKTEGIKTELENKYFLRIDEMYTINLRGLHKMEVTDIQTQCNRLSGGQLYKIPYKGFDAYIMPKISTLLMNDKTKI